MTRVGSAQRLQVESLFVFQHVAINCFWRDSEVVSRFASWIWKLLMAEKLVGYGLSGIWFVELCIGLIDTRDVRWFGRTYETFSFGSWSCTWEDDSNVFFDLELYIGTAVRCTCLCNINHVGYLCGHWAAKRVNWNEVYWAYTTWLVRLYEWSIALLS